MGDRVKVRLYWVVFAGWLVVWTIQLVRVAMSDASMTNRPAAVIYLVSFGIFLLVAAWSKDAREEAKSKRIDERRLAHEVETS